MNRNHINDFTLIKHSSDLRLKHSFSDLVCAQIVKNGLLVKVPEDSKSRGTGTLMCLDFEETWQK